MTNSIMVSYQRKCPKCSKDFMIPGREYTYKIAQPNGHIWCYCSYTCWRIAKQEHVEKGVKNRANMGRKKE